MVFRFFPVSCCDLYDPAHSTTALAPRSSTYPKSRSVEVTVLAASSSYLDRPSLPAPVMKVRRIISFNSKGVANADLIVVSMVETEFPARSKVSLSNDVDYFLCVLNCICERW